MTTNESPAYTEDDVKSAHLAWLAKMVSEGPNGPGDVDILAMDAALAAVAPGIAARAVEPVRAELDGRNDALALEVTRHAEHERALIDAQARLAAVAALVDRYDEAAARAFTISSREEWRRRAQEIRAALGVDPAAHDAETVDTRCTVMVNGRRCVKHEDHIEGIGGDVEHRPENPRYGGQG